MGRRNTKLWLYLAWVNYGHLSWKEHADVKDGPTGYQVDRIPFPVVATSKRHAKRLAQEAWGRADATITVTRVGPCQEPEEGEDG